MKKRIQRLTAVLLLCSVLAFAAVVYGEFTIPDTVQVLSEEDAFLPPLYSGTDGDVRFLGSVAVKRNQVQTASRVYAEPLGSAFGIKLYTDGVMIVRTDAVETEDGSVSPAQKAGLRAGDMILAVDGTAIRSNAQIASLFLASDGEPLRLRVQRESVVFETQLTAVRSAADGKFRAGIWVRDSSAGIGTLTFAVPQYGMFAGLGHAVCDIDTGKRMPLHGGEAVDVHIQGSFKGRGGEPGELCGVFANRSIGTLTDNTDSGIFGTYEQTSSNTLLPVAMYYEVQEGAATILAEVDDTGTREYDVQITKLFKNPDAMQKNLIIKVTDPDLIEKTGGIVQGMSGSPILQNGMIVGAVTHVFIQDSLQGFGIYAQTMLRQMQQAVGQKAS